MDYVESTFQLDDIIPLTPLDDQDNNPTHQELQPQPPPPSRRRRQDDALPNNNTVTPEIDEQKKRKIIRRDAERRRRQQMSALYSSLRSQLPADYLKGKRSISDHMDEAVKYIKDMERRIQELSLVKNKLKQMAGDYSTDEAETSKRRRSIVVKPSCVGVQVMASFGVETEFTLLKLVEALMEEGLKIINCNSTKIDGRLLHKIETQVNGEMRISVYQLEQKLSNLF